MSNDKKNIDRLFQEKFKDFEVSPDEKVWKNIAKELEGNSKKRLVIPLWFKIGGVAALIALMVFFGNELIKAPQGPGVVNNPATKTLENNATNRSQQPDNKFNQQKTSVVHDNTSAKNSKNTSLINKNTSKSGKLETAVASQSTNQHTTSKNPEAVSAKKEAEKNKKPATLVEKDQENTTNIAVNETTLPSLEEKSKKETSASVAENSDQKDTRIAQSQEQKGLQKNDLNRSTLKNPEKNGIATAENAKENTRENIDGDTSSVKLADNGSEKPVEEPKKSLLEIAKNQAQNTEEDFVEVKNGNKGHWVVSPNVSPIYSNGLNGGNAIDPKFNNNKSEGEISFSYGVNFAYAVSNKIKVRSGISKVNVGYNVNDVAFSPTVRSITLASLKPGKSNRDVAVAASPNEFKRPSHNELLATDNVASYTTGSLHQQMGFIEVPLEIEYALLDQKFGINLIGGASTLFLNKNTIFIDSKRGETDLGEANNLNNVSFTTNVGVGFDYQLTQQFKVNLEPTFKYQLNTFSGNSNGFNPYYFGVYTGLSFSF